MSEVMLIEDNADDVELARRAFCRLGMTHHVEVATDGAQALDYLLARGAWRERQTAGGIKLILLDLNLPRQSGLDVLREIRRHPETQTVPVVVLTASRKEPDLLQSFTMGVVDYLIKPLEDERFLEIYRKYVTAS